MNYKSIIPNACTSLNLVFGICSIISTLEADYHLAAIFILLALVADGLDGRTARFFGVSSEMGKEMDSLCDCVSFGAAPAILAYSFVMHDFGIIGMIAVIFYAVCGMLRLARFNVNAATVHGYFMGVPIPAGGCTIATWVLLSSSIGYNAYVQYSSLGYILPISIILLGYLLVSSFKYPDFKGKGLPVGKLSIIIVSIIAIIILYMGRDALFYAILFAIFGSYVLVGLINAVVQLKHN